MNGGAEEEAENVYGPAVSGYWGGGTPAWLCFTIHILALADELYLFSDKY